MENWVRSLLSGQSGQMFRVPGVGGASQTPAATTLAAINSFFCVLLQFKDGLCIHTRMNVFGSEFDSVSCPDAFVRSTDAVCCFCVRVCVMLF